MCAPSLGLGLCGLVQEAASQRESKGTQCDIMGMGATLCAKEAAAAVRQGQWNNEDGVQQPRTHPAHTRHGLCGEREWLRSLSSLGRDAVQSVWLACCAAGAKAQDAVCEGGQRARLTVWAWKCGQEDSVSDALSSMTRLGLVKLRVDGG